MKNKYNSGFSIVELLVVFAIIVSLLGVVLVSVTDSRKKAHDAKVKDELHQISLALDLYYHDFKTYYISQSGENGSGQGFAAYRNGTTYTQAVTERLSELGYLKSVSTQPTPNYLIYTCNNNEQIPGTGSSSAQQYTLYATLMFPTEQDIENVTNRGCMMSIGVNPVDNGVNYGTGFGLQ